MKRIISILILITIFGCTQTEKNVIEKFKNNEEEFDNFISNAINDQNLISNTGKLTPFDKLQEETKNCLNRLGLKNVTYIILDNSYCKNQGELEIEIIFNGNWHLEYKSCGELNTQLGEYSEEGFIESWGLNERWILWKNNDFIG